MKSDLPMGVKDARTLAMLCAAALLAAPLAVLAQQQILAPTPQYSETPPALQEDELNQPGIAPPEYLAPSGQGQSAPLQYGPVAVHPHVVYQVTYGTGIESSPSNAQNTVVQQFDPGVLIALGSHWTLDYTPLFTFYSSSQFQNTVDQSVSLHWGTTYQDWSLGISQGYISSSAPLVETATQTDTETYSTSLKASYQFNTKWSVDLTANQNFSFATGFTSDREWSTLDWLNFNAWDKASIGLGVGYEYDDLSPGPDTEEEQLQGRVQVRVTDKTSFVASVGLEDQQALGSGVGSRITPVFGISAQYQLFATTLLTLSAQRGVSPSFFEGQTTESSAVTIAASQRFLGKLNASASFSYGKTSYLGTTGGVVPGAGRTDDYYSFSAHLGTIILKRGAASIFYQFGDNSSTVAGYSYSSSQAGFELDYRL